MCNSDILLFIAYRNIINYSVWKFYQGIYYFVFVVLQHGFIDTLYFATGDYILQSVLYTDATRIYITNIAFIMLTSIVLLMHRNCNLPLRNFCFYHNYCVLKCYQDIHYFVATAIQHSVTDTLYYVTGNYILQSVLYTVF